MKMLSRSGEIGDVEDNLVADAKKAGFVPAVKMQNPNTAEIAYIPFDLAGRYLTAQWNIVHE